MPKFAQELMKTDSQIAQGILDDWLFSGITQFASGYPLQASNLNFRLSGALQQTCEYASQNPATASLCTGKPATEVVTI